MFLVKFFKIWRNFFRNLTFRIRIYERGSELKKSRKLQKLYAITSSSSTSSSFSSTCNYTCSHNGNGCKFGSEHFSIRIIRMPEIKRSFSRLSMLVFRSTHSSEQSWRDELLRYRIVRCYTKNSSVTMLMMMITHLLPDSTYFASIETNFV